MNDEVLSLVAAYTGSISAVRSVSAGYRAGRKAIVTTDRGQFFVKAFEESNPATADPREVAVYPLLGRVAPALIAYERSPDWMVLVYAFFNGRHCDLRPGSPDVAKAVAVVDAVGNVELPKRLWRLPAAWECEASPDEVEALSGRSLLHSDLQPENILVNERAVLVDWAAPASGSPIVNLTELVTQLIAAGHTPQAAEVHIASCGAWSRAGDLADTAAAMLLRMHRGWEKQSPGWALRYPDGSWLRGISKAVEVWAEHRNVTS